MKALILPALAALIAAGVQAHATPEISDEAMASYAQANTAKAKKVMKPRRARAARPQRQVACTWMGCHEVPPGCTPREGRYWSGLSTGFDVVDCSGRRGRY